MTAAIKKLNTPKLVTAFAKDLHIAPRKVRLVTNLVKGMNVVDAMVELQHTTKKAAPMVLKLIKSAVANAQHNFALDPESLVIKSITADMGKVMKRYFPRARGSAFIIRRKMSHINIVLEEKVAKGKKAGRNLDFLKAKKDETVEGKAPEQVVDGEKKVKEVKKQRVIKTDEQRKMNTITQKRRLFNRKSGE